MKSNENIMQTSFLLKRVICLTLLISTIFLFPWHHLKDNEKSDNPNHARYYITLYSILANYPLLATDKANIRFIKTKIANFEHDIKKMPKMPNIDKYKEQYYNRLSELGLKSIANAQKPTAILQAARHTYDVIDNYYLDSRIFYINPLYDWRYGSARRILKFNLGSLFDLIPNRYMRILGAYGNDSQLGIYSGFFVNNQTTTLTPQFMTGMPMLTALYLMPKHNYALVGAYTALVPWGYYTSTKLLDPMIRKLLDISGIDVFGVLRSDMAERHIKNIPNTETIAKNTLPLFASDYQPLLNKQSYGMTYLANTIHSVNPYEIKKRENVIKHYFSAGNNRQPAIFEEQINALYKMLMQLKSKHDIVLEFEGFSELEKTSAIPAGTSEIQGFVGGRAMINTNCNRSSCFLVFNLSQRPGWHVYVNQKLGEILRANFAFMATKVPQGISTVWFIYESAVSVISYFISIISLTFLFAWAQYKLRV